MQLLAFILNLLPANLPTSRRNLSDPKNLVRQIPLARLLKEKKTPRRRLYLSSIAEIG
jgi:hypothetical protein